MSEHKHIVSAFEQELEALKSRIIEMGGLAERSVADAVSALDTRDAELAARTVAADTRIDDMETEIEEKAILMLARRQPLAADLREVMAAMRIASNLERIGDLAKNIAKRTAAIGNEHRPQQVSRGVNHMADLALLQLRDVLNACARRDAATAVAVRNRDGEIDALYNSLFRELLTYMMEDPRSITRVAHLLFCAKNIERIGDHATNVAETVYYLVTGNRLSGERQKDDSHNYATVPFKPAT
ncbi:MAG TPA: phosphate signaling complex protein PhoU [Rhizomicrobium sp.]|jgi:phosphate transport system protein